MEGYHDSVLLNEVIEGLDIKEGKWYLDCTLGDGGYTRAIIERGGKVLGIDVDPQAIERVLKRFGDEQIKESSFKLVQGNFRDLENLIEQIPIKSVQTENLDQKFAGAVFDLGVSSLQLDSPEKGFSFMKEGPLDMRMDPTLSVKALDLINALNKGELYELFTKLGEEEHAKTLASAVVFSRGVSEIKTTRDLAEIAEKSLGRRGKIHPATKIFQALRIAVNDELNALKEGLISVIDHIESKGRVAVVSFHSLEDRIVKETFRDWEEKGIGEIVTGKPVIPGEEEQRINKRSRSAKMRVFKKT